MQTKQNRTIGILGGMGPLATVDLFRRIVEMADSPNDQGHPRVLIDSNTNISDRTAAILNGGADPLPEMVRAALLLERGGADVLIMGCNTAHYFYPEICRFVHVPFLNMLEETAKAALDKGFGSVGLLATDGTIRSGVYAREFERHGIELLTPGPEGQKALMEMIYSGVKAGKTSWPTGAVAQVLSDLAGRGARAAVLGCTELPLALENYRIESPLPLLDPTAILAKSALAAVGSKIRAEFL